jgi:DNA-binding MarR family transcriptional regulator
MKTKQADSTPAGAALTELMLETFRLNGRLLAAGDRLVAPIGLTSARWQVLGAVALAGQPLPVAYIARNMGLTRQAVQRVANELAADGLIDFADNPHHRRARLVTLTAAGNKAYTSAMTRHTNWSNALGEHLIPRTISGALRVMRALRSALERAEKS